MRRKLISIDAFNEIQNKSVSKSEKELKEATYLLANTLGCGPLTLKFINESVAVYETVNGTYVYANYRVDDDNVVLENVHELVVNIDSQKKEIREAISKMLVALKEDSENNADKHFNKACDLFLRYRKSGVIDDLCEKTLVKTKKISTGDAKNTVDPHWKLEKNKKMVAGKTDKAKHAEEKAKKTVPFKFGEKLNLFKNNKPFKKMVKEWSNSAEKIFNYVGFIEDAFRQRIVTVNENADSMILSFPISTIRNEQKADSIQHRVLNTQVKCYREKAFELLDNGDFSILVGKLKKANNLEQSDELQECLDTIGNKFSELLYVTEGELAALIKGTLEYAGQQNFDDETCLFMAEGVLRNMYAIYDARIAKIQQLAQVEITEGDDAYLVTQAKITDLFSRIDESINKERELFVELYNSLVDVKDIASEMKSEELVKQTVSFLYDLKDIVENKKTPDLELAMEVASYLSTLSEEVTNNLGWTKVVDNMAGAGFPSLEKISKMDGIPANNLGYSDPNGQSVGDGKSIKGNAKANRDSGFSNVSNADTYPNVKNPHIPKAGDFTMKFEKGADKDYKTAGLASMEDGDTYPKLKNPYLPKSLKPKIQGTGDTKAVADLKA